MEGHRGGYPSASGSSWTFFEENAKEYGMKVLNTGVLSSKHKVLVLHS